MGQLFILDCKAITVNLGTQKNGTGWRDRRKTRISKYGDITPPHSSAAEAEAL